MSRRQLAIWALVAATLAIYLAMVLWSLQRIAPAAGGETPFDLRPLGYDFEAARAFLAALPASEVRFYLDVQQRPDAAFPVLLAVTLMAGLMRLTEGWPPRAQVILMLVPALGALFDFMKNTAVRRMLHAGAEGLTVDLVTRANSWTALKSAADAVAVTALVLLLVWRGWQRWRKGGS